MMRTWLGVGIVVGMAALGGWVGAGQARVDKGAAMDTPVVDGGMSVEVAIARRRSAREFAQRALTPTQISQLCWAAQGVTDKVSGHRAAPSAGALYPIELYIVTAEGVAHYEPNGHRLGEHLGGDMRRAVRRAALDQEAIEGAPACFVVAGVVKRTAKKYGDRAERYVFMEAGHVGQNLLLQATSLGLVGVPIGAFEDEAVAKVLKLPAGQRVLYLLPIGYAGE